MQCHSFPLGDDPIVFPSTLAISNSSEVSADQEDSVSTQSVQEGQSSAAFCITGGNVWPRQLMERQQAGWAVALEAAWLVFCRDQGHPQGEGLSQGMSKVLPQQIAEPWPALHEELPRPLAELSCPLSTKPPCTHMDRFCLLTCQAALPWCQSLPR